MQDINFNQLTLYRFVSLRSPELYDQSSANSNFVEHPIPSRGKFYEAIIKDAGKTPHLEVLDLVAKSFDNLSTVDQVSEVNPDFFKVAKWLAQNSSSENYKDLAKRLFLNLRYKLDSIQLDVVWDNYIYQVLKQESFYVKELLAQGLILQKIFNDIGNRSEAEVELLLPRILRPNIVLPSLLFGDLVNQTSNQQITVPVSQPQNYSRPGKFLIAESNKLLHRSLLKQLEEFYNEEKAALSKLYSQEYALYQEQLESAYSQFDQDYKIEKRRLLDLYKDENLEKDDYRLEPQISLPSVARFEFNKEIEFSLEALSLRLSQNELDLLTSIKSKYDFSDYQEALEAVRKELLLLRTESKLLRPKKKKTNIIGEVAFTNAKQYNRVSPIKYTLCSKPLPNGTIGIQFSLEVAPEILQISFFSISALLNDNTYLLDMDRFVDQEAEPDNVIDDLFSNRLTLAIYNQITEFEVHFEYTNGTAVSLKIENYLPKVGTCVDGYLQNSESEAPQETPFTDNPFVPKGYGINSLGIAEYRKVVAEICCYEAGEVSHIENVMASELKSKTSTTSYKSEVTEFEGSEIESENLNDVISSSRLQMQSEIAKIVSEQKNLSAYVDVSTSYGTTQLNAGAAFASTKSKEESDRQAIDQAKELTERAVERITSRISKEKTVKITNEHSEQIVHAFDNRGGSSHVSGVFRFINAVYKNQVYNYGKRLMYEFLIPQPGALHELGSSIDSDSAVNMNTTILKPIHPKSLNLNTYADIAEDNYLEFAEVYGISVDLFPERFKYISKSVNAVKAGPHETIEESKEIQLPEGYETVDLRLNLSAKFDGDRGQPHAINVVVGNYHHSVFGLHQDYWFPSGNGPSTELVFLLKPFQDTINFSYSLYNYTACNIAVTILVQLSAHRIEQWKKSVYDAILNAYNEQLTLYNESVNAAIRNGKEQIAVNPLFYRQIEQMTLRRMCISYLTDQNPTSYKRLGRNMLQGATSFIDIGALQTAELDNYASFVKFMEQAFEWKIMSYHHYPYYWANNQDWKKLYQTHCDDLNFKNFLQSGMTRVVVTVTPGFETAVLHYMATGQIWNGGSIPVADDPLYRSIVDELKEQEYMVEETWKTVLPTNLVALQRGGVAVAEDGLPCSCPEVDALNRVLQNNSATLTLASK